jgi:hypothetical protein
MARPRGTADVDPFADLAKKVEILEREMAVQRVALDKLKDMGTSSRKTHEPVQHPIRKTA